MWTEDNKYVSGIQITATKVSHENLNNNKLKKKCVYIFKFNFNKKNIYIKF